MTGPVACTLDPAAFRDRTTAWRELLEGWLLHREDLAEGLQLELQGAPGVAEAAIKLAQLEAACCPWMSIAVSQTSGRVWLRITSEEEAGASTIRQFGLGV